MPTSDLDFMLDDEVPEDYVNDDIQLLTSAWISEQCAPELLLFQDQLVENLIEMIQAQVNK